MTKSERLAQRLILLFASAMTACAEASAPATNDVNPADLVADLNHQLDRLRALQIVEIESLVVAEPFESQDCYSLHPCITAKPELIAEYRHQQPRLNHLVELAERLAKQPSLPTTESTSTPADLLALQKLQIVHVGALVAAVAPVSANCYNLPCAEDLKKAADLNRHRADVAHALAGVVTEEEPW
jgi:hypothetical protein